MDSVIDIDEAGADADVLTETGGGLLGRSLLHDDPLAAHLDDDERPRYVLRNKKAGVVVEGGAGEDVHEPVGRYSGLALVTDARVLFAVGGRDGDRTLSVSLADVVDVRVDDAGRADALVLETVDDTDYRFPCTGELAPVQEYLDAAVGVWTRAQSRIERAEAQLDRLQEAFESGDADVVLAAIGDVRETLADAREEAEPLPGASERVGARADDVAETLAALDRRAYAEQAEQARERAHVRWDDHEYEEAFDHLDDAREAYDAAAAIDADRPSDDLLDRRIETLADERERLAAAPVDRADHAADVATAAEDPGAAIDWWETAVERYETALSLDWGRDERRFDGDRETLRDRLAEAAAELVAAYCALARDHIADGDGDRETNPDGARVAYDLAAEALADAREVAQERLPDGTDEIDDVADTLAERRRALPDTGRGVGAQSDGGRATTKQTVVDPADDDDDAEDGTVDRQTPIETGEADDAGDGETDDTDTDAEPADADADSEPVEPDADGEAVGADTETEPADIGLDDGDVATDAEQSSASTDSDGANGAPQSAPETADSSAESVESGTGEPGVTDPAAVEASSFASLVAAVFEAADWTTTLSASDEDRQYDVLAETAAPVGVSACVWTVHPDAVEAVDAARIERAAAYVDRVEEGDAAVVCSAAPVTQTARERAEEYGVELLDEAALRDRLATFDIDAEAL
jgi:hypothetical protein